MRVQDVLQGAAADTRAQIIGSAIQLFAKNGFDGTSIRDIVEAAGVTKPVLYYYFKNKQDLCESIISMIYDEFLDEIRSIVQADLPYPQRLKNLIAYYVRCSREDDEAAIRFIFSIAFGPFKLFEMVNLMQWEERHLDLLHQFLQEGIDLGLVRSAPLKPMVMHVIGSVIVYMQARLLQYEIPEDQLEDQIVSLLMSGIQGASG